MAFNIDDLHFVHVGNSSFIAANEDIFNGNPSTDIVNMELYNDAYLLIIKSAGATGTATITCGSCDTVVPGTATAVAFEYKACTSADTWGAWTAAATSGFVTTAGANQMYLCHVSADMLSGANKFVRFTLTETVNDPCDGAVVLFMANPRFSPNPSVTALA